MGLAVRRAPNNHAPPNRLTPNPATIPWISRRLALRHHRARAALLDGLDSTRARVADVGAGNGYFSQALGETLRRRGLDPGERIAACDVVPQEFRYAPVQCTPIGADGRLPYPDAAFEAVVSIEVVEHVENQFAFLRELSRIAKPGAVIVVTTPNTLNANSRLRGLLQGFPLLFDPLPLDSGDVAI
jgi:2-polyprenyl-3-methyl-5-hydroxy-6-metoxy-1,4-benzoquinol methylase